MKRKIKLTEKDFRIEVRSSWNDEYNDADRNGGIVDTSAKCPQTVFDPGCPDYSQATCLCGNLTRNCTEFITKRYDNQDCAETYIGDCNIPVTDNTLRLTYCKCNTSGANCYDTIADCITPTSDILSNCGPCEDTVQCAVSDDCGESFPCPATGISHEINTCNGSAFASCETNCMICIETTFCKTDN